MEFHGMSFFVNEEDLQYGPKVSIKAVDKDDPDPWPISLYIKPNQPIRDGISIHLNNELQLIQFKNSVLEAYNNYRKGRGYGR